MSILHDHLRVRKRCPRWIPYLLTDKQGRVRVEWCEFMLRKFNGARSKLTWEVLTGDKTWIYRYNPETKMQSSVWLFPNESSSKKSQKIEQRTEENGCLFLRKIGPCRHHSSEGQTVTDCGVVGASLSPEGLRSLIPAPPKDGTPWPFNS